MNNNEYFNHRNFLLDESKDENGFISDSAFLNICLPNLSETKLTDTDEVNESFCTLDNDLLRIDGYIINESGERLQVFILNDESIDLSKSGEELSISQKSYYDKLFNRAVNFIKKAIKRHLDDIVQDSSPAKALIAYLASSEGIEQIDIIEFFLISATLTIETRGEEPQPKAINFEDDSINVSFTKERKKVEKEIIIVKRLIDLNFLYNVAISQGNREALTIDFTSSPFNYKITCIQAASEENFDSFLCVLPATLLAELYKRYSSRMLEKNVRSFLQLKGVNKGMQDTIKKTPEKFIAYNNGLTITATNKEIISENGNLYIKSLTDFQIVNGGQTTATIYFSKKDGYDVSKIKIMAKINVAKNATEDELDDLISNISTFSNAQSRVSKVDLRSRNPQLVKLKSLSESIVTPTGKKWFFERAKGEYKTMLRKASKRKNRIEKEYPKERRFTKEELAKYYSAWGNKPYMVKKGGEKIFRYFIEDISGDGSKRKLPEMNRDFFENLISRIILFRDLENIYGQGKNSFGQIRAAVIPYSISILYQSLDGAKENRFFDLTKIWLKEGLEDDLIQHFTDLMKLMNKLIKKYSQSDDLSEYSKTEDLWENISQSEEIDSFVNTPNSLKIIKKYSISKAERDKRNEKDLKFNEVDFKFIQDNVSVFANGISFYKDLISLYSKKLSKSDELKIATISSCIYKLEDIDESHLTFEKELINLIIKEEPEIFDKLKFEPDISFSNTLDFIIAKYNAVIEKHQDLISEFKKIGDIVNAKGLKYASVWNTIGELLRAGEAPSIKQISFASNYFGATSNKLNSSSSNNNNIKSITLSLLKKMVEWDAKAKVLSLNERQYLTDLAYGFKVLNAFHETHAKKHLQTLIKAGFDLK
jgi:hypothetical protein